MDTRRNRGGALCTLMTHAALLCALGAAGPAPLGAQSGAKVAHAYREAHEAEILASFAELLRIPNVASDREDIRRAAQYIADALEGAGVDAELLEVDDAPPIVYGTLSVPGATRTLGIYVHYDGQPADPSRWTHAPWEPVLYTAAMEAGGRERPFPKAGEAVNPEWRVYARSAGDDKAPIAALLPVLRSFRQASVTPTSNLKFFFEGEEEAGSTHLRRYLETFRDRIDDIDVWLFFDGPAHASGRPQLTFGVRGVTGLEVTVYGAVRPLHSGHYGNWAPVPGNLLSHLLAGMKAETGKVLIPGFYDTVAPVGEEERAALAALPDYDAALKKELGLTWTEGEPASLAERLMLPSLTIRGLSSGNTGRLARNVIPASATATLGIRLVKGNDPGHMLDLVEAYIERQGYHIVREDPDMATRLRYRKIARVVRDGGYPAARTSMNNPRVQEVIAAARRAATSAFGGDPLVLLPALGGSLPLYLFTDVMGKPAVNVPVANHDDNQHAPDENLRIANLWYAIDLYGALLTMPPPAVP